MSAIPLVLCPIDLSPHSAVVVQHAGAVAEHFGASLLVVSVQDSGAGPGALLESLVHDVLPHPTASRIEWQWLGEGGPFAARPILQLAHDRSADLIVMGGHGLSGFGARAALGSTIGGVLAGTDIPTLVVPRLGARLETLRELRHLGSVLAPTDFSALSRRDVRIGAGLAAAIGVPLLLLHVLPEVRGFHDSEQRWELRHAVARNALDALRRELHAPAVELLVRCGAAGDEIAQVAAQKHAGLIVMGLRGVGGAHDSGAGSIATRVLCLAPTLMLTIPPALARRVGAAAVRETAGQA
jgi:nucleotide-binding universal stress UspA family protein